MTTHGGTQVFLHRPARMACAFCVRPTSDSPRGYSWIVIGLLWTCIVELGSSVTAGGWDESCL
eukprot:12864246-Prorocentrum_lima.AAC.1